MSARYETKVGPKNRNVEYATPVVVYAENRRSAISRAIDIGWAGDARDAQVWVLSVEEIQPTPERRESQPEEATDA